MRSALRFALSGMGVGCICYLLAMATWQQVLMMFLFASFALTLLAWRWEHQRINYGSKPALIKKSQLVEAYVAPKREVGLAMPMPVPVRMPISASVPMPMSGREQPRSIYRFPIHQLARAKTVE